jgi:hypothetical protein
LQGGSLAKLERENAILILGGWLAESTKLFAVSSFDNVALQATVAVIEVTDTGVLLKSLEGDTQLSIGLAAPDTEFWYWEPREFSSNEEFAALLASLPDADRYRSAIGISFSGRVTAPNFADLVVPLGRIVLMALWD